MGDGGYREGDIEPILLQMKINLKSDVLKVGHHGSTYTSSNEFMDEVLPEYAVITSAKITSTGHPHKKALERIAMRCKNILQSKNEGTILFGENEAYNNLCHLLDSTNIKPSLKKVLDLGISDSDLKTILRISNYVSNSRDISISEIEFIKILENISAKGKLDKVGNGYTILLINNDVSPKQIIKQSFEYLEDAQDRYSEIVKCFINGWNDFETRTNILKTGCCWK